MENSNFHCAAMKITPQSLWSNFELSTVLLWIVWTKNKYTGCPCVIHRDLWTKFEIDKDYC